MMLSFKKIYNNIFNNGHLQTILPLYLTDFFISNLDYYRERIDTVDGDFLDLDWINYNLINAPTIILAPGLEGSSYSHYAKRIMTYIKSIGWRGVVINARGCSGELNRTFSFYHAGWTEDICYCINYISQKSVKEVFVVGVSLGGNALLKLLALDHEIKNMVKAAVTISVPFDLSITSHSIDRGMNKLLYLPYFLKTLLPKMKLYSMKHHTLEYNQTINSMHKFNAYYITKFGGFNDVNDYYDTSSSMYYIEDVDIPTLMIQASNDPMVSSSTWPKINNPRITFKSLKSGGHAGFLKIGFNIKNAMFELPKEMINYYQSYL